MSSDLEAAEIKLGSMESKLSELGLFESRLTELGLFESRLTELGLSENKIQAAQSKIGAEVEAAKKRIQGTETKVYELQTKSVRLTLLL